MAIRRIRCVLFFLFFTASLFRLSAQSDEYIYSFIREEDGKRLFIQHIAWQEARNVRHYEFVVEAQTPGTARETTAPETGGTQYTEVLRIKTQDAFAEFSLPSGAYRYKVETYDLLNRFTGEAPWNYFVIITALEPEIDSFSPQEIKKEKGAVYSISVSGKNLSPEAGVFLRSRKKGQVFEADRIEADAAEETLTIYFSGPVPGFYDLCIRNPGGLEDTAGTLAVIPSDTRFAVSGGYAPLIPLYGVLFDAFDGFFPIGLYGRFTYMHYKNSWGDIGFELTPYWNYLLKQDDDYTGKVHLFGAYADAVFKKQLPLKTLFFNARLGAGITSLVNLHFTYEEDESGTFHGLYMSFAAEVSLQWFPLGTWPVTSPFFVEIGLGYDHIFTGGETRQGYFRPFLGAGYCF